RWIGVLLFILMVVFTIWYIVVLFQVRAATEKAREKGPSGLATSSPCSGCLSGEDLTQVALRRPRIDGLEEFVPLDRLGYVRVLAGVEAALAVPLHGMRRQGHNGEMTVGFPLPGTDRCRRHGGAGHYPLHLPWSCPVELLALGLSDSAFGRESDLRRFDA